MRPISLIFITILSLHGCILEFGVYEMFYRGSAEEKRFFLEQLDTKIPQPALNYMLSQRYNKALKVLKRRYIANPMDHGALEGMVFCFDKLHAYDQALSWLDRLPSSTENSFHRFIIATRRDFHNGWIDLKHDQLNVQAFQIHQRLLKKEIIFADESHDPVLAQLLYILFKTHSCHVKLIDRELYAARFIKASGFADAAKINDEIRSIRMQYLYFGFVIFIIPPVNNALVDFSYKKILQFTTPVTMMILTAPIIAAEPSSFASTTGTAP